MGENLLMKKLVIIPAYNESENIVNTVKEIKEKARSMSAVIPFSLIFIVSPICIEHTPFMSKFSPILSDISREKGYSLL